MPNSRPPKEPDSGLSGDKRRNAKTAPDLRQLHAQLQALMEATRATQQELLKRWHPQLVKGGFLPSAANLAAYIGLRRHDLRELQAQLAALGLSSLGRCEGHVLATLDAVDNALRHMLRLPVDAARLSAAANEMEREEQLLRKHAARLLGDAPLHRWTRFMVTLSVEAAHDYPYVKELLERGMNCARINCAHDDAAAWDKMADNVRQAERETGLVCKVLVDLAGPKLRTGPVAPAPPVLHLKPKRNELGQTVHPASLVLDASGQPGHQAIRNKLGQSVSARMSVAKAWLKNLKPGDVILLRDLRQRRRELLVQDWLSENEVLVTCDHGAYIPPGTILEHHARTGTRTGNKSRKPARTASLEFTPLPVEIRVEMGDILLLTRQPKPGEPARRDAAGRVTALAHIGCEPAEIFDCLHPGEMVSIDDGRIGGLIESIDDTGAWLRITRARRGGERVAADKGLNFPDSAINLPALSQKDLDDLDFAVRRADIVGYSFVNSGEDMDRLVRELEQRGGHALGIVAKVETRRAVENLPDIIIRGAGRHPFGVMIARGDLAVEIGFERMAEIQEEILWLCEAAHVPVIWATQVLENLVKQDIPSRAEITDAAMSERAECVMLNKGPYLFSALAVLDSVVMRMQGHQTKKTAKFRALHW